MLAGFVGLLLMAFYAVSLLLPIGLSRRKAHLCKIDLW